MTWLRALTFLVLGFTIGLIFPYIVDYLSGDYREHPFVGADV